MQSGIGGSSHNLSHCHLNEEALYNTANSNYSRQQYSSSTVGGDISFKTNNLARVGYDTVHGEVPKITANAIPAMYAGVGMGT